MIGVLVGVDDIWRVRLIPWLHERGGEGERKGGREEGRAGGKQWKGTNIIL